MSIVKYSVLFLMPIIKTKIWAGNRLVNQLKDYGQNVGEVWLCSGLADNSNIITNLDKNITLRDFYQQHNNYFVNNSNDMQHFSDQFPLLVKFIDAGADLSVQLHPNYSDERSYLNKNEAWYVLDCADNSKILYGHNAKNINEFKHEYANKNYEQLFRWQTIQAGQIWYIPSGTIHAILSNTLILEVQQPSDITYRLYDYDRLDESGNCRELHIDQVYEHLSFDNQDDNSQNVYNDKLPVIQNTVQNILTTAYFKIYRLIVSERAGFSVQELLCCQVIAGSGSMLVHTKDEVLHQYDLATGASFILLNTVDYIEFIGNLSIILEVRK
jgi:mannose-6-phosphate isomerase